MTEWLLAALLLEKVLETRERRLLLREKRRLVRAKIVRQIVVSITALAAVAFALCGAKIPC